MQIFPYISDVLFPDYCGVNVLLIVFTCISFVGLYLYRSHKSSLLNRIPSKRRRELECPESGARFPVQHELEQGKNSQQLDKECECRTLVKQPSENEADIADPWESFVMDDKAMMYKKKAILGIGATGIVYLVQTVRNETMALKEILQMSDTDTEKRMKALRKSKQICYGCSNLLMIHAVEKRAFMNCQKIFVLTEYCTGGTLRSRASAATIPHFLLYDYMRQILTALRYLHSFGIVHRDIKSDNILLQRRNSQECLKIGDFDYSKAMSRPNSQDCAVSAGYGTYLFMAPEVVRGNATRERVGRKADIWSAGCVVVELFNEGSIPAFRLQDGQVLLTSRFEEQQIALAVASGAIPDAPFGPRYAGGNELSRFYDCFDSDPDSRPEADALLQDLTTPVTTISDSSASLIQACAELVRLDSRYTPTEFDCVYRLIEGLILERSCKPHPNIIYPVEVMRRFSYTSATTETGRRSCMDVLWEVPDFKSVRLPYNPSNMNHLIESAPSNWRTKRDDWLKSLAMALKDVVTHLLALDLHNMHQNGYLHFDMECFMHEAAGMDSNEAVCQVRLLPFGTLRSHRSMWSSHPDVCWNGLLEFRRLLREIALRDLQGDNPLWLTTLYDWVPWLRYNRRTGQP